MPLVKIANVYVDLAKCSFALSDFASEGPKIKVFFGSSDDFYIFSLKSHPKEYKDLETYLASQETLEQHNARRIRDAIYDPFLDEMPPLYALFRSLPDANSMRMCLFADGSGRLTDGDSTEALVAWSDLDDALVKLDAYKREHDAGNGLPMFL